MFSLVAGHFSHNCRSSGISRRISRKEQMALWELKVKPAGVTWRSLGDLQGVCWFVALPVHEMLGGLSVHQW